MKSHFVIEGMHCAGCVERVRTSLESIDGVSRASVSLPNRAVVESSKPLSAETLTNALAVRGNYIVREGFPSIADRLQPFAPLAAMFTLVFAWSLLATFIWSHGGTHVYHDWMRFFMGGFFLLFGGLKLFNLKNFAVMYRGYDVIAKRVPWWGFVYPFVEIELAILYLFNLYPSFTNVATAILMSVGTVGIVHKLRAGTVQTCACLGGFFSVPLTWVTVLENLLMVGMAIWMLIFP